ncbi:hypothetical protein [Pectobacterium carotovorum]|uniref:hypothetical protein n=1 Tax=Pectobacterium carotovorum TaxID=554 RepID=UPI0038737D25
MSKKTYEYRVTITFDLSYSKTPEYRFINSYLDEKGFYSLKSLDEHMPSNIYTGTTFAEVEVAGTVPTFNELKTGSDKAVRNVFESIKRNAENAGIDITLYVQASPEFMTSARRSRA